MDDLTFSARRASTVAPPVQPSEPTELDARFRTLVQSPLRAGILRYLSARPEESFDVEALMQTFGRLRLDVENCVRELVDFGVAEVVPGDPPKYGAKRTPAFAEHWISSSSGVPRSAARTSRRRSSDSAR
jgi:hypothetical protein